MRQAFLPTLSTRLAEKGLHSGLRVKKKLPRGSGKGYLRRSNRQNLRSSTIRCTILRLYLVRALRAFFSHITSLSRSPFHCNDSFFPSSHDRSDLLPLPLRLLPTSTSHHTRNCTFTDHSDSTINTISSCQRRILTLPLPRLMYLPTVSRTDIRLLSSSSIFSSSPMTHPDEQAKKLP